LRADVTITTIDTSVAHIMDQQEAITIKSFKRWNPIGPPTILLT
ncbi:Os10g0181900, partial [Oryza sativa Japonica Group]